MALLVEVKINSQWLYTVSATRISNTTTAKLSPNDTSEYLIQKWPPGAGVIDCGTIYHRYGAGAGVLAERALEAARVVEG